jgi:hypothetical protein
MVLETAGFARQTFRLTAMRTRLHALMILTWLAATALPAGEAAADQPKMHMHRTAVGDGHMGTWRDATSTEGHFTVSLPIAFNDFTVDGEDGVEVVRTHAVGGKSLDGFKFMAMRMVYRDGAAAAGRYFNKFRDEAIFGHEQRDRRRLRHNGLEAVQITASNSTSWTKQRVVKLESDLIMMVVEAPAGTEEKTEPLVRKFFDSLKITGE